MTAPTKQDIQNVKNAVDRLCLKLDGNNTEVNEILTEIKTLVDVVVSGVPTSSVTRSKSLTGTLSTLTAEDCIMVEIRNTDTTAITLQANGGVSELLAANSFTPIYTTNTSNILVSGTGTMYYKVVK